MCGIFGAAFVDGAQRIDAAAALRAIAHRGPDASKIYRAPGVVLGHDRLAILDLSPEADQPMTSEREDVALVFNGEIYNHHALRAELAARGHTFRTRSDTEVIVRGYQEWGDAVVARLDGMFALGVFDAKRRRLFLARDRAGKKPLFYAPIGAGLAFGSEMKALFAAGVARRVDAASLPILLALGYTPSPRTVYEGVVELSPGSTLAFEEGREPTLSRYWRAPFAAPRIAASANEASGRVRELVTAAVERRLEADVPLGAFLSGGLDSTIVVGVMARLSRQRVRTFSIGFAGDARFDETRYARIAAAAFGTDHTEFTLEPSSFDLVGRLVEQYDGPFGDSSAIPTAILSQLTRKHVTVALSGDGGDEIFCGYSRFLAAEAEERVPMPLRRAGDAVARLALGAGANRRAARVLRLAARASAPLAERLLTWNSFFAGDLATLLRPGVARGVGQDDAAVYTRGVLARTAGAPLMARILAHNFETYLPYDLLVKSDRASMLHSLELRSPLLDTALVEYAARLPAHLLRRGTRTKWILRRAFRELVPEAILRRPKMGFGVPLGAWFRGDLRPYLLDHLSRNAALFDYVEPAFVTRLLDEHFSGREDHGHRIWLLLTTQLWLRQLRDSATPSDSAASAAFGASGVA